MDNIKSITIDLETKTLDPWYPYNIVLIGYRYNSIGPSKIIYTCNGEKPDETFLAALRDRTIPIRGHNVHFDALCLTACGYGVGGLFDDTRIVAYLENPYQPLGLKDLVEKKLSRKVVRIEDFGRPKFTKKQLERHPKLIGNLVQVGYTGGSMYVAKTTLAKYCQSDIVNCDDLKRDQVSTKWYKEVEQPLISVLFRAEREGMQIDIPYFKELKNEFDTKIQELEKAFPEGFNPRSPKQIIAKLETDYQITVPLKHDKKGSHKSADGHFLKLLSWSDSSASGFAKQLLEHRRYAKLCGTYLDPIIQSSDANGRIHGRFNQAGRESQEHGDINGPATGRLSSSDPNLQNIPTRTEAGKKLRKGFIAGPGKALIISDLPQIEPRTLTHYCQSKKLIDSYASGIDTHKRMAADMFGKTVEEITAHERTIGKTGWLQISYRSGYKKLRFMVENFSDSPLPDSYNDSFYSSIISNWWDKNLEIKEWEEQHIQETRAKGFLTTIGGREIRIPNLNSFNKIDRWAAERQCINYQIQGSAADIMKMILVRLDKELNGLGIILASVHDEVIVECPKEHAEKVRQITAHVMSTTVKLKNVDIPTEAHIVTNWSEKK